MKGFKGAHHSSRMDYGAKKMGKKANGGASGSTKASYGKSAKVKESRAKSFS